jgi:hypothetical protein
MGYWTTIECGWKNGQHRTFSSTYSFPNLNDSAQPLIQELIKTNEERKERTKRNIYKTDKYFERHPEYIFKKYFILL